MTLTAKKSASLHYKIEFPRPHDHYAKVTIAIDQPTEKIYRFSMPVWTPGSYLVREFSKSVERVNCHVVKNGAEEIPQKYQRNNKNTWEVAVPKGSSKLVFTYWVYAFELSVRTSFIDQEHAFLHNTSMFMRVNEMDRQPGTLEIQLPPEWKNISTAMPQNQAGHFTFQDYDELADHPIEIGNHTTFTFNVRGVPHEVALVGVNNCDTQRFKKDLEKICEASTKVIDEHPCKKYVLIVLNVENGGGGLEHLNSATVMMGRWNWIDEAKYQSFLGLCAHEYFHLWNVKRIRPIELGPFDYDKENYTTLLWVAEGITSYYDEILMMRAGFTTADKFIGSMQGYISDVENRPGTRILSLEHASLDAWIKEYRPNENSKNVQISYYSKGLVVAMLLDLSIAKSTQGKKNLDDLMQLLWNRYYKAGRGFTAAEFEQAASEVAGTDLSKQFDLWLRSTEPLNYEWVTSGCGLEFKNTLGNKPGLGMVTVVENGRVMVKSLDRNGAGYAGGINANDEIIAIQGNRVLGNPDDMLKTLGHPSQIKVTLSRAGLLIDLTMPYFPLPFTTYQLSASADNKTDAAALNIRNKWLSVYKW